MFFSSSSLFSVPRSAQVRLSSSSAFMRSVISRSTEMAISFPPTLISRPVASAVNTEPSLRLCRTTKLTPDFPWFPIVIAREAPGSAFNIDTGLPIISSRE